MDSKAPVRCGVLVISDRCFRKATRDESGPALKNLLRETKQFPTTVEAFACVPDCVDDIKSILLSWSDVLKLDLVITSGGTGFGIRDVTPEATAAVLDRNAPGMMTALFQQSYPHSILSRGVCGTRKSTMVMNFPGSPKACRECFAIVEPKLSHIFDLLRDNLAAVSRSHHEKEYVSVPLSSSTNPGGDASEDFTPGPAFRHRKSPFPIIPVPDAQAMVLQEAELIGEEIVHFHDALGRILANDVTAKDPLPPFRASIKDGYAVLAADGDGERLLVGASHAGSPQQGDNLLPGFCMRITTGAPLPPGADAIVQVEDTQLVSHDEKTGEELVVRIMKSPKLDQDIRPVGSDIQAGAVVAGAGTKVDPGCLGVLATCGATRVSVFKMPKLGLLSTGDELVLPDTTPLPVGKIRDSNKTVLLHTFQKHGFTPLDFGIARDSPDILMNSFRRAASIADVIVLTGGVSMGEKDLVKPMLTKVFNGTIHFGRVFMKPGLPTTFATLTFEGKKKLVFGLPGNPVSAAVTFNLFVLPAVRKMSGYPNPMYNVVRAEVTRDIKLDPRPEFHRALLDWGSGKNWPVAHSTGNQISSRLLSVSGADVLLCLPPKTDEKSVISAGEIVDTILL